MHELITSALGLAEEEEEEEKEEEEEEQQQQQQDATGRRRRRRRKMRITKKNCQQNYHLSGRLMNLSRRFLILVGVTGKLCVADPVCGYSVIKIKFQYLENVVVYKTTSCTVS